MMKNLASHGDGILESGGAAAVQRAGRIVIRRHESKMADYASAPTRLRAPKGARSGPTTVDCRGCLQ
jgi:hypothetical protein